ncbi:MAG: hypothetical protein C0467_23215 [Planctomycetaceae bacterium]|nr:hypothetical protein [Planctomycetaceae bacterium]
MTTSQPTVCAYCGTDQGLFQAEHVIPRCLWEADRPGHMLTVPACGPCNHGYGRDEEYFRTVLVALTGQGSHPQVNQLLGGKVRRALKRNPRLREDMTRNVRPMPRRSPGGLFAGVRLGFELDVKRFYRGVEKTVRGLFAYKSGRPLAPSTAVRIYEGNGFWETPGFQSLLEEMSEPAGVGDDVFSCRCARYSVDPEWSAWLLIYYQTQGFFAWTEPLGSSHEIAGEDTGIRDRGIASRLATNSNIVDPEGS